MIQAEEIQGVEGVDGTELIEEISDAEADELPGVPAEDPQPAGEQVSPVELFVLLTRQVYAGLADKNSAKTRVDRDILRIAAEGARFLMPLYMGRS